MTLQASSNATRASEDSSETYPYPAFLIRFTPYPAFVVYRKLCLLACLGSNCKLLQSSVLMFLRVTMSASFEGHCLNTQSKYCVMTRRRPQTSTIKGDRPTLVNSGRNWRSVDPTKTAQGKVRSVEIW